MLSFSAEELSTIDGRRMNALSVAEFKSKSFNLRDLPCPPQNVMVGTCSLNPLRILLTAIPQEANWYTPEPGVPYRPNIAMPDQLKRKLMQEYPFFSSFPSCIAGFFAAVDPPHALRTEALLLPPLPPNDPKPAPVPSPTQDPGPGETPAHKRPVLVPAGVPTVEQPEPTTKLGSSPNHGEPVPGPHSNDHGPYDVSPPDSIPSARHTNQGNHPKQGNEPKQDSNPSQTNRNVEQVKDPSKSYLLPENLLAVKRNGKSDGNTDEDDPKQTDKASSIEEDARQDVQLVNVLKAPTSQDLTNDPILGSEGPTQPLNFPNPFYAFGKGQPRNINDQVGRPLSEGVSDAGTPGAPFISVSGTPIVYGPSALAVGSGTILLAFDDPNFTSMTKNIAGQTVTIGRDAIAVAGKTLSPGASAITISGTLIPLGSSALIIGSSKIPLSQSADPLITTVAGHTITAAPNAIEVAGTTLRPGVPGVTLDGTAVSLDTAGHLVVGSKTMTLAVEGAGLGEQILKAFGDDPASDASDPMTTSIGGQVVTAAPTGVAFAGTTLTPGAPGKTIAGTLISLNTAGRLLVDAQTIPFPSNSAGLEEAGHRRTSGMSDALTTTIAGQAITAAPTAVVFADTTLTPEAPGKMIAGTLISLNTAGQLVVGSKTVGLTRESAGLGGLIKGAFGANGPPDRSITPAPIGGNFSTGTTDTGAEIFRGEAEDVESVLSVWKVGIALVAAMAFTGSI